MKIKCCLSNPHIKYYISSIYFIHQIFVPSEIQRHFYIHTPFFLHFQIWPFWPQKPKNSNLTNSFLTHYPQPKMNQKSPKEPKWSQINPHLNHETAVHILLEDAAYRCFYLAGTDLAHLNPNRATHLKSPKNKSFWAIFTAWETGSVWGLSNFTYWSFSSAGKYGFLAVLFLETFGESLHAAEVVFSTFDAVYGVVHESAGVAGCVLTISLTSLFLVCIVSEKITQENAMQRWDFVKSLSCNLRVCTLHACGKISTSYVRTKTKLVALHEIYWCDSQCGLINSTWDNEGGPFCWLHPEALKPCSSFPEQNQDVEQKGDIKAHFSPSGIFIWNSLGVYYSNGSRKTTMRRSSKILRWNVAFSPQKLRAMLPSDCVSYFCES